MQHPLRLYIDLIENNQIFNLIQDFSHEERIKFIFYQDYGDWATVKWIKDKSIYTVSIFNPNENPLDYDLDLNGYIRETLLSYNKSIKKEIRDYLFDKSNSITKDFIEKILIELDNLKNFKLNIKNSTYSVVLEHLALLEFAIKKYIGHAHSIKSNEKLRWLGNLNTLTTLFKDLSSTNNNLNQQLLDYDRTALTNFIIENFLDGNGNPLSKSTIYTYLDKERYDKDAKKKKMLVRENDNEPIAYAVPEKVVKKYKHSKAGIAEIINPNALKKNNKV